VSFKRNLAISIALGVAGGLVAYALAWGLFTTHQELDMNSGNAAAMAAWTAPIVFLASLVYLTVRSSSRR